MEQKIFNLGLPIETVSVYLLCCALDDLGVPITLNALQQRWNSTAEALHKGLADLEELAIVVRQKHRQYGLNTASRWQTGSRQQENR